MPGAGVRSRFGKVIRVILYKTVAPSEDWHSRRDYYVWGSSNFLYVDVFPSLSKLAHIDEERVTRAISDGSVPVNEERQLYLYKDPATDLYPRRPVDWIFRSKPGHQLLTITLLKAGDLRTIYSTARASISAQECYVDVYRTIGYGAGVLVFRSKTYDSVLGCLVELNALSSNTYSIAGVENPLASEARPRKPGARVFSKTSPRDRTRRIQTRSCVTIDFILKHSDGSAGRVGDVLILIEVLYQRIRDRLGIPSDELIVTRSYQIGLYDIEVRVEGCVDHILEFLLNPEYGLVNVQSAFYTEHIFESRTTWKMTTPLGPTIES